MEEPRMAVVKEKAEAVVDLERQQEGVHSGD